MHSGNIGHAQDLETLIRAAGALEDLDRLAVVLIGFGARHAHHVRLAASLGADRVSFLDYQPRELLSQSLSSADIHFVGLARGLAGYVVPSRLYGILAAGRPVLAGADEDSETARLVRQVSGALWDRHPAWSPGPDRDQPVRELAARRARPGRGWAAWTRLGRGERRPRGRAPPLPRGARRAARQRRRGVEQDPR